MKVAVLLSGGVDSSVALKRLIDEGFSVTAFYLKIWLEEEMSFLGDCPWEEDLKFAEAVCKKFEVKLKVIPLQREYHDKVVAYCLEELKKGRTPNPDVLCNKEIKFGAFLEYIETSFPDEFHFIASGHYAQKTEEGEFCKLKMAKDSFKDQTYFLSRISQKQLKKLIFPIGDLLKQEVRELADKFDLPNKNRKDSQGVCFLGKIDFSDFIRQHLGEREGELIEFETGKKIGNHKGVWFYTLGQRKGIGLGGGPWYVVKKDLEKNLVYVSNQYFEEDKQRNSFFITDLHEIADPLDFKNLDNLQVKIRHGEKLYKVLEVQAEDSRCLVKIDGDDQGIAAGQFAVFYRDEFCLGSGVIC